MITHALEQPLKPEWVETIRSYDPTLELFWNQHRRVWMIAQRMTKPEPWAPFFAGSEVPRLDNGTTMYWYVADLRDSSGKTYEPHPDVVIAWCEILTRKEDDPAWRALIEAENERLNPRMRPFPELEQSEVFREFDEQARRFIENPLARKCRRRSVDMKPREKKLLFDSTLR